jgi:hypothetical protein
MCGVPPVCCAKAVEEMRSVERTETKECVVQALLFRLWNHGTPERRACYHHVCATPDSAVLRTREQAEQQLVLIIIIPNGKPFCIHQPVTVPTSSCTEPCQERLAAALYAPLMSSCSPDPLTGHISYAQTCPLQLATPPTPPLPPAH